MGMDLIMYQDGQPVLIDQMLSDYKRDIYMEKWLGEGEYLLVPKSSGIDFC